MMPNKQKIIQERMFKMAASTLNMGDSMTAGRGIADIVKFIISRVPRNKYPEYLARLRQQIYEINPSEIAAKSSPESSTLGQSLTFVKTILRGHHPLYIAEVLKNILVNL